MSVARLLFKLLNLLIWLTNGFYCLAGSFILKNTTSAINSCSTIWIYVTVGTVMNGMACLQSLISYLVTVCGMHDYRESKAQSIIGVVFQIITAIILMIWGGVIWTDMEGDCKDIFRSDYKNLWTIYQFTFWYATIIIIGIVIIGLITGILFCQSVYNKEGLFERANFARALSTNHFKHIIGEAVPGLDDNKSVTPPAQHISPHITSESDHVIDAKEFHRLESDYHLNKNSPDKEKSILV
jgi:hypothetical protein